MSNFTQIIRRYIYIILGNIDAIFGRVNPITILAYHGISDSDWRFDVSPKTFGIQMSYLSKKYHFVSLSDIEGYIYEKKSLPNPCIAITFDDGYANIPQIQPILDKYKIKPTVFALSNSRQLDRHQMGINTPVLSFAKLRQLSDQGWLIGCHSATHPDFYKLSSEQLNFEIANASKQLNNKTGIKIKYFAFPRGRYTSEILGKLKSTNFRLGLTMDDSAINHNSNPLKLPRVGVDKSHSLSEFPYLNSPSVITFRQLVKSSLIGRWITV